MNYPAPPFAFFEAADVMSDGNEPVFDALERTVICEVLHRTGGRQDHAAKLLRITRREMNYKCARYGLRPKDVLRSIA